MKTGAVAFLDILGFKGIWQHREEKEVLSALQKIPELVARTYVAPTQEQGWPPTGQPTVTVLSDTVIVTIESEHPHALLLMCAIVSAVLHHFLVHKMFARGAIGWGNYTQEGSLFLGPAIDDVAMWYEAANWVGVITTPKTNYMIDRLGNREFMSNGKKVDPFIKYDVPLKTGKTISLNAFNWPGLMQPGYTSGGSFRQTMIGYFSEQDSIDASVHEKYEHTLRFIDYALRES